MPKITTNSLGSGESLLQLLLHLSGEMFVEENHWQTRP